MSVCCAVWCLHSLIVFCRFSGGMKLLNCRNAAGLTAAKLAARHGHEACAQLLDTIKKLGVRGGPAGDGRSPAQETATAAKVSTEDAGEASGEQSGDKIPIAVVTTSTTVIYGPTDGQPPPAVSVLPEILEVKAPGRVSSAAVKAGKMSTPADIRTSTSVAAQTARRCQSALPAARRGQLTMQPPDTHHTH